MENFYKSLDEKTRQAADMGEYNFDHPDAIDFPLLENVLVKLANREAVEIPIYDFQQHQRLIL